MQRKFVIRLPKQKKKRKKKKTLNYYYRKISFIIRGKEVYVLSGFSVFFFKRNEWNSKNITSDHSGFRTDLDILYE